jgi:outer membrane lipoprotein-sorting protein
MMRSQLKVLAAFLVSLTFLTRADPSTTLPATPPAGIDAALWTRMIAIDAKAEKILDLSADFEQQKFTPLLKKPMISSGTVRAKGSAMFWDTRKPEPTMMRVDEKEVRIYYPNAKTLEIYPLAGQLSALAASPLPRLAALLPHFKFAPASAKDLGEQEAANRLPVQLTPIDESLREHVDHVTVLIDADRGFILAFQLIDADGERTVIHFTNVKTNQNLEDARLQLALPADVKTVHPLENLGTPPKK